ncbi:translation initiation factor IF-2 [Candidatus Woesearchaeota archaeon]|nr:translation initiation factor IF-2 [Candidatus Woesearchaeota archaeon]
MTPAIRSPICTVLGHVDHGKSSLLDAIRQSNIVAGEAGKITQAIGASIIPLSVIKKITGPLLKAVPMSFSIPGLLFIDTPGHAAFTTLRKRGGSLADIAIVVIDINEGAKPQTRESIDILRISKTPFIVAANKIDLIPGWKRGKGTLLETVAKQPADVQAKLDTKLYEIVGQLNSMGFRGERFDRVEDYTKQVAIIPVSAITKEGIPELLMVLTGLCQKYLEHGLECDVSGMAKGTILEVKEVKGLGKTIDVIIYNGRLRLNDTIVLGSINGPIVTKVKALLEPAPLTEMRDKKAKFRPVKEACAATGVKIAALDLGNAVAGMPMIAATAAALAQAKRDVQRELQDVLIETDKEGIIVKADSLGSLEALIKLLKEKGIPIRKASLGNISKNDIADAEAAHEQKNRVIIGFEVQAERSQKVKIITANVIYHLLDQLEEHQQSVQKKGEAAELDSLPKPCKIKILSGYIFRQSNPAVCGTEVLAGTLQAGASLMKNGIALTEVKEIQDNGKSIPQAERGKQVAVAYTKVIVGRQLHEEDVLYSHITEEEFRKFRELKEQLSADEVAVLKEIAAIMRRQSVMWGV